MVHMAELEQRILSELEEAGAEEICTLLNTVFQPAGTEQEAIEFTSALTSLVRSDMAVMATFSQGVKWSDAPKSTSIEMIDGLIAQLRFDPVANLWRDARDPGPPKRVYLPMVACTAAGRKCAFEILDQRGYQWWRNKE